MVSGINTGIGSSSSSSYSINSSTIPPTYGSNVGIFIEEIMVVCQNYPDLINNNYHPGLVNKPFYKQALWKYQVSNEVVGKGTGIGTPVGMDYTYIPTNVVTAAGPSATYIVSEVQRGGQPKVINVHKAEIIESVPNNIVLSEKYLVIKVLIFSISDTTWSYKSITFLWLFLGHISKTTTNMLMYSIIGAFQKSEGID